MKTVAGTRIWEVALTETFSMVFLKVKAIPPQTMSELTCQDFFFTYRLGFMADEKGRTLSNILSMS